MGKSNLIVALNNATIYNSLLKGCKVCFKPFTAKKPIPTKRCHFQAATLVSVLSIRGLHVSKSGKSICCEVEYLNCDNETNTTKLYVTFNKDETALILHSNNIIWGTISTEYNSIELPSEIVE
jgi:hypothetical protein